MFVSKVYSDEIEDRIDAPFYQEKYLQPIRKIKERMNVRSFGYLIKSVRNGVEIREFVKKGTPYLRVSDLKFPFCSLTDVNYVKESVNDIPKNVRLGKNSLLFSRGGTVGIVSIVTENILGCIISSDIKKIELENSVKPEYMVVYLNSRLGKLQTERVTSGGIMDKVSNPSLYAIKVPVPPPEEQEKFVKIMNLASKKHILALDKIEKAKSILVEAIGINVNAIKEPKIYGISNSDLSDQFTPKFYYPKYVNTFRKLEETFVLRPLGKIAHIQRGKGTRVKQYAEEGIPFIRTSDIIDYEIDAYPDFHASESTYKGFNQPTKEGDILYTIEGKIGFSAMILEGEKCVYKNHIEKIRIKEDEDVDPYYAFLFLNTDFGLFQAYQRAVIQATMWGLSNKLREIKIPILPKDKGKAEEFERKKGEAVSLAKEAFKLKKERKELIKEARQLFDDMI